METTTNPTGIARRVAEARKANHAAGQAWNEAMMRGDRAAAAALYVRQCQLGEPDCDRTDAHEIH